MSKYEQKIKAVKDLQEEYDRRIEKKMLILAYHVLCVINKNAVILTKRLQ